MGILEIIAFTFTLICVYLTSKQNIWCWATGIVGVIAFFLICLEQKLYFQTVLQVIFLIQSIIGWYKWKKGTGGYELRVKKQQTVKFIVQFVSIIVISTIIGYFLGKHIGGTLPILDTITSGMALLATYYLINKYIGAWLVWMGVNILLGGMMLYQGLYIIGILEGVLFAISLNAYIGWKKDLKMDYV